jgi:hypothetical protein
MWQDSYPQGTSRNSRGQRSQIAFSAYVPVEKVDPVSGSWYPKYSEYPKYLKYPLKPPRFAVVAIIPLRTLEAQ